MIDLRKDKNNKEQDLLRNYEYEINSVIVKLMFFASFVGPAMLAFSLLGVFNIPVFISALYTALILVAASIMRYMNNNEKLFKYARIYGLIILEIIICLCATRESIGTYITLAFTTMISCLYIDLNFTRFICVISYFGMLASLYFRSHNAVEMGVTTESWQQLFMGNALGFSIEFVILYAVTSSIVKYENRLLKNQEEQITERMAAEEENRAKSDFLAQMSHEIRTPINAVMGMDEMIMRESNEPAIQNYARTIDSACRSLLTIVNDILDFSKIQSGKMEIVPREFNTTDFLRDLIGLYGVQADNKGLDFDYEVSEDLPTMLIGDDYRLKQAAGNLISNAIKYTSSGFVHVRVEFHKESLSSNTGKFNLAVVDSGLGIKTEDIPKLFQKFGRLDQVKNRSIEGTGLGLRITKQLIDMMDGNVAVQSVYGEGSIFTMIIPLTIASFETVGDFSEMLKKQEEIKSRVDHSAKGLTCPDAEILVVDDNEMNLQVVSSLLKKTQCNIKLLSSGEEALEEVKKKDYDLILLDHMMPGMDGIETLHAMRNLSPSLPEQTRVVVLTANAISGAKEQYLSEGFDDYISKPIVIDELERILKENLPADKVFLAEVEEDSDEDRADLVLPNLAQYGIDSKAGLELMDNELSIYADMAGAFVTDYEKKLAKLNEALLASDMPNYAILVHGLKGNARTLGAIELGDHAFLEEQKAKAGDIDFIKSDLPCLIEKWQKTIEGMKILVESINGAPDEDVQLDYDNLPEMSESDLNDAINVMMTYLEEFQQDEAMVAMEEVLKHDIPMETRVAIENACSLLNEFNFEDAQRALEPLIKGE